MICWTALPKNEVRFSIQNAVQAVTQACTSLDIHTINNVQNKYEVTPHLSSHEDL